MYIQIIKFLSIRHKSNAQIRLIQSIPIKNKQISPLSQKILRKRNPIKNDRRIHRTFPNWRHVET